MKSMQPESAALLWDVHAAATRIAGFIVGLNVTTFANDELRRSAVDDAVVWGAASQRVPELLVVVDRLLAD